MSAPVSWNNDADTLIDTAGTKWSRFMNEEKRGEWLGAILSLLYEFNWPMTEKEIFERSNRSSDVEDLRTLLADLKKSGLISDLVPGNWKLTKKGKELVRKSLG
jgi:predicted transcriptional regulator